MNPTIWKYIVEHFNKSRGDDYSAEVEGMDYRALEANIKTIETEQAKRSSLLANPDALRKEAVSNGISVSKQRALYKSNFDNNAPRLEAYKEFLPNTPKADTSGIVFKDILPPPEDKPRRGHSRYGRSGGGGFPRDILESKTAPRGLLGPRKRKY